MTTAGPPDGSRGGSGGAGPGRNGTRERAPHGERRRAEGGGPGARAGRRGGAGSQRFPPRSLPSRARARAPPPSSPGARRRRASPVSRASARPRPSAASAATASRAGAGGCRSLAGSGAGRLAGGRAGGGAFGESFYPRIQRRCFISGCSQCLFHVKENPLETGRAWDAFKRERGFHGWVLSLEHRSLHAAFLAARRLENKHRSRK